MHNRSRAHARSTFLAQYMRMKPCILPLCTISSCAAFHSKSWVFPSSSSCLHAPPPTFTICMPIHAGVFSTHAAEEGDPAGPGPGHRTVVEPYTAGVHQHHRPTHYDDMHGHNVLFSGLTGCRCIRACRWHASAGSPWPRGSKRPRYHSWACRSSSYRTALSAPQPLPGMHPLPPALPHNLASISQLLHNLNVCWKQRLFCISTSNQCEVRSDCR